MAEYINRENLQKVMAFVTNDSTCPLHIAAEIDQAIALEPAADVALRSEFANAIITEIDDKLHDMAMEYANVGRMEYFAVCEMVHHKVISKVKAEYCKDISSLDTQISEAQNKTVQEKNSVIKTEPER